MKKKDIIISVPEKRIESKILLIRGQKVMMDSDLAELYGVKTFNLNKAVKRNIDRFPSDFMFRLTKEETNSLTFQIGMSKTKGRGGRRYIPYVFTEQGVAMLSSVLNSKRAIQVNIQIMRAFTKLREILTTHKDLQRKIEEHDEQIKYIFKILKQMLTLPETPKRKIGFLS
ncbi:MAG: DNA-binding protein [Elusimicrobia bacterium HGW-Elusimicrobia-4]|nr:MAG: DNA-binding protein [Elusimicrobia bacterium HGW-Elusimicrobia-4]